MLTPCVSCGAPVRSGTCACPSCGRSVCASAGVRPSSAALVLGLALGGCRLGDGKPDLDADVQPPYGVPVVDADGDGYDDDVDCDDADPEIHPNAEELPGDGVDQDCDGEDDT